MHQIPFVTLCGRAVPEFLELTNQVADDLTAVNGLFLCKKTGDAAPRWNKHALAMWTNQIIAQDVLLAVRALD